MKQKISGGKSFFLTKTAFFVAVLFGLTLFASSPALSAGTHFSDPGHSHNRDDGADRITVEELKDRLVSGANVIVIDVRVTKNFVKPPKLIKGAFWIPYNNIDTMAVNLPKNAEIVTYCA
ncbi:MAG: hypothetical protein KAT46_07730 [Deltaproteobacteria bacterium]|nr:hypothetical protein [Deltaproteobacteria bacterium]